MTFNQILQDIQHKIFSPIYFFYGEEPFFIDQLIAYIEKNALEEEVRDFNQTVCYGRDVTPKDIIDMSRRFPMMGNYQLVIVKEAQEIKNIELIEPYMNALMDTTILVIGYKYKKLDKRKSFFKTLNKLNKVVLFESQRLYDDKIPDWIEKAVHLMGYSIDAISSRLLSDYLGNDLGRISNELEKLVINLEAGSTITTQEIEQHIGISKDFNIFELQSALVARNGLKAHRIVQYFEANPKDHPLQMLTVVLHGFFNKLFLYHHIKQMDSRKVAAELGINPFFIKDYQKAARVFSVQKIKTILSGIRELDLKSKGLGASDATSYGPLKELVVKIMH